MRRLRNFLIAVDQLGNTLLAGWPDETISSRAHRMGGEKRRWAVARAAIDWLFFWEENHCQQSYLSERQRRQLPPELRKEQ